MNNFYNRLNSYFLQVANVLQGSSNSALIFPNPVDKGLTRENIYKRFLEDHLPSSCKIISGGYLFDQNGKESQQMDLVVISHVSPQYNFHNEDGSGKSFAMVDGTLSTISIKSFLDSKQINDTLSNMASIPDKTIKPGMMNPYLPIPDYDDWPLKVIFAFDGVSIETAHDAVYSFYENNPEIPVTKRPNIIHVLGKYFAVKTNEKSTIDGKPVPKDQYFFTEHDNPDVYAFFYVISEIQKHAWSSQHIGFRFWDEFDKVIYPDKFSE